MAMGRETRKRACQPHPCAHMCVCTSLPATDCNTLNARCVWWGVCECHAVPCHAGRCVHIQGRPSYIDQRKYSNKTQGSKAMSCAKQGVELMQQNKLEDACVRIMSHVGLQCVTP